LATRTWRLVTDATQSGPNRALLVNGDGELPVGFDLYVSTARPANEQGNWIQIPRELSYLGPGDIISVSADGCQVSVVWRANSLQNSILLTERCDNYCLMCSQPPRDRDDHWLLERAFEIVSLLPADVVGICFTGGEPTIYGNELVELLCFTHTRLPEADVHLLSNGRRFANTDFTALYAQIDNPRLMVGIPIYGHDACLHDHVVQADGAFSETIRGVMNLAAFGARVELRVVIHKQTAPAIVSIANYIARNLPFVDQVALMGLEMMGLARPNAKELWIDPYDYRAELGEAAALLDAAGIRTLIYNHQLCVLEESSWRFAVRSISDWKNEYLEECASCGMATECGGFFTSTTSWPSRYIHPLARADHLDSQR
jgi:His-Xaa-Ser system radical SAM maturase HxsC